MGVARCRPARNGRQGGRAVLCVAGRQIVGFADGLGDDEGEELLETPPVVGDGDDIKQRDDEDMFQYLLRRVQTKKSVILDCFDFLTWLSLFLYLMNLLHLVLSFLYIIMLRSREENIRILA